MEEVKISAGGKTYKIDIESGLFSKLPDILKKKYTGKKLALVSDSNVFPLYGEEFYTKLTQAGFQVIPVIFQAGEGRKNLETLSQIYAKLAEGEFTRSDSVLAFGGGVTGDMAGLAAATFLRGMGFIQIPTTLLAMVDSSIGGKVAVDLPQGKNLVGAFYQPDAVYTDPMLLDMLTNRQFSDGMAELLKHGFIRDASLYKDLTEEVASSSVGANDYCSEGLMPRQVLAGRLDGLIARSCIIKRDVVEADEKDNGIRQLLNFGHTLGHAIERVQNYTGLSHGEAISIGMVVMTRLTEKMGLTREGEAQKLVEALALYGLPVTMPSLDIKDILAAIRLDKKTRSGMITIAYIEKIGLGKLRELEIKELEDRIHDILTDSINTP